MKTLKCTRPFNFAADKAHRRKPSAGVVTYVKLFPRSNAVCGKSQRSHLNKIEGTNQNSYPLFMLKELVSVYANLLLSACLMLKLNPSVDKSEERIILTDTNIVTGMNSCSSLSYEDVAGENYLTVSSLNAKALGFAITAVLSGTDTLLMSKEL